MRVHKSIRVESEALDRIRALMEEGETESAAIVRAIEAGLDALEAGGGAGEPTDAAEGRGTVEAGDGRLVEALQAHVDTLAAEVDTLRGQLEAKDAQISVKDGQIEALTRITEQSQTLHAVAERRAIESKDGKRRGLLARILGRGGE